MLYSILLTNPTLQRSMVLPFIEATIADSGCGCRPQKKLAVCKNTNIGQTHLLLSVTFIGNVVVRVKSCFQCSHHRERNCNDHCLVRVRAWSDHYQFCGRSAVLPQCRVRWSSFGIKEFAGRFIRKKENWWDLMHVYFELYVLCIQFNYTCVFSYMKYCTEKITLFPLHTSRWR